MDTKLKIYTVDAFTDKPFSGNPAAVCLLDDDISDELKQRIAAEMNISETAFVTKEKKEDDFSSGVRFNLRWFTPTNEVPLCGHATLATATIIFREASNINRALRNGGIKTMNSTNKGTKEALRGILNSIDLKALARYSPVVPNLMLYHLAKEIEFNTLSGILTATKVQNRIELDLPLSSPEACDPNQYSRLVTEAACGLPVKEVLISNSAKKLLVRLDDSVQQRELEAIKPKTGKMEILESSGLVRGVILTLKAGVKFDFVSRYFAPWNGIPEDPVTGSAHTVLAPYWSRELNKQELVARQCSPRGGTLYLKIKDGRVKASGESVVVLTGSINVGAN